MQSALYCWVHLSSRAHAFVALNMQVTESSKGLTDATQHQGIPFSTYSAMEKDNTVFKENSAL